MIIEALLVVGASACRERIGADPRVDRELSR